MPKKITPNPQIAQWARTGKPAVVTVIDATGASAGRLASYVAKRLLAGEEVHIVNAEKATISGSLESVMERYHFKRDVGTTKTGPFYPRVPHMMMKRTVRGMLNYQELPSHRAAYKRLRCHIGVPDELEGKPVIQEEKAKSSAQRAITFGEIATRLGGKFGQV
ncbi:MAG TPA: 50S ribosomal protein L13 [Candidatus Thermoplasmatota archaeon]|nr:50S ribosomal protein L13 [Candidatus Thermoplasmatota archaeon]